MPHYTPCELRAPLRRPSGTGSGQIPLLISRRGQKNPRLGARGGGVDRDGLSTGWRGPRLQIPGFCTQGGRDRRRWDAGGDSRDAEAVLEALRTCLGLLDADVGHGPGDLPMGGRPRSGLEGFAGGLRRR